jgi:hypothetical protein
MTTANLLISFTNIYCSTKPLYTGLISQLLDFQFSYIFKPGCQNRYQDVASWLSAVLAVHKGLHENVGNLVLQVTFPLSGLRDKGRLRSVLWKFICFMNILSGKCWPLCYLTQWHPMKQKPVVREVATWLVLFPLLKKPCFFWTAAAASCVSAWTLTAE